MRFFVTRPHVDGLGTAQKLESLGHTSLLSPLLGVEYIDKKIEGDVGAYVFTSLNGVRASEFLKLNKKTPVFTVGDKTGQLSQERGFENIYSAGGNLEQLEKLIFENLDKCEGKIIHFSGKNMRGDLTGVLNSKGIPAERQIIYRAKMKTDMPQALKKALKLKEIDAGVFYSARTATTFKNMVKKNDLGESIKCLSAFVLSNNVKLGLDGLDWKNIFVAIKPNEEALFDQIEKNCSN